MKVAVLAIGAIVVLSSGCVQQTCNTYGCSSPAQATAKVTGNALNTLNAADVQVLRDVALQFTGVTLPEVSEDQAWAVTQLIQTLGITTLQSVEPAIRAAQADPSFLQRVDPRALEILQQLVGNPDAWIAAGTQIGQKYGAAQ